MTLSTATTASARFSRSLPAPLSILLLSFFALCALLSYGYSLRLAISYAVERENIVEDIALTRASITSLDNTYGALTQSLSIEKAKVLGFHEVTDPLYISLSSAPETVGLRAR